MLLAQIVLVVFFGALHVLEVEAVTQHLLSYVLFKIVTVWAIIDVIHEGQDDKDDFGEILKWFAWFTFVGFLNSFAVLCRVRLDYVNTSLHVFEHRNFKLLVLLILILAMNVGAMVWTVQSFASYSVNWKLFRLFENNVLLIDSVHSIFRYLVNVRDQLVGAYGCVPSCA